MDSGQSKCYSEIRCWWFECGVYNTKNERVCRCCCVWGSWTKEGAMAVEEETEGRIWDNFLCYIYAIWSLQCYIYCLHFLFLTFLLHFLSLNLANCSADNMNVLIASSFSSSLDTRFRIFSCIITQLTFNSWQKLLVLKKIKTLTATCISYSTMNLSTSTVIKRN